MLNAVLSFLHAHPLLSATLWLGAGLALDVIGGAADGWIRGEFRLDKLVQVLKTKLVENPYARAILGLYAGAFLAQGQDSKAALIAATVVATALYSAPVWRDVVLKAIAIIQDLYARISKAPLPARA